MSDLSGMSAIGAVNGRVATLVSGRGGLQSFGDLLGSARAVGPQLDLPSDPIPTAVVPRSAITVGGSAAVPTSISTADLPDRAQQWLGPIADAADRHGVDVHLLTALVWTESAFRPDAVSPAGAIGLGQLMPGTAGDLGVDPHDPVQNLDGAARYIREQLDRFGSDELALAAYNAGPGRVIRSGGVPNIHETQSYVQIVTARRDQLRGGAA